MHEIDSFHKSGILILRAPKPASLSALARNENRYMERCTLVRFHPNIAVSDMQKLRQGDGQAHQLLPRILFPPFSASR